MWPILAVRIAFVTIAAILIGIKLDEENDKEMEPSKRPKKKEDEYDSKIDDVIVSIFTRNVDLFSSSSKSPPLINDGTDAEHRRHWALVFTFPNTDRVITYDANEVNDHLVYSCSNSAPEKTNGGKYYPNIARCRTSPKKLQEIAKNISINYKPYNMCFRNCQTWVLSFVRELGHNVYAPIVKKFKSFSEKEPVISCILGSANVVMNVTKKLSD